MVFTGSPERNVRDFLEVYGSRLDILKEKQVQLDQVEELILVDIGGASRLGRFSELTRSGIPVTIYNHHMTSDGDLPGACVISRPLGATTSILLEHIIDAGIQLTPFEATLMALGIYEDTGSLLYRSTTEEDLRLAAYLVSVGADLGTVAEFISRELTIEQMALLGDLARSLEQRTVHQVVVAIATARVPRYIGDLAVLTHKIKDVHNLNALFSIVQMGDRTYVVGRSKIVPVNVGDILRRIGGGGHPTAGSAVLYRTSVEEARERLLGVLEQEVRPEAIAREVMAFPVDTIGPECTIEEARRRILDTHHSCLPILEEGQLIGLVTKRDVAKAVHHGLGKSSVVRCMSPDVVTAAPETSLFQLQQLMAEHKIGHVPIVENGHLVGIVSRTDLLNFMATRRLRTRAVATVTSHEGEAFDPDRIVSLMEERLSDRLRDLFRRLGAIGDQMGYSIYAVGGLPRDLLLNRPNLDVDVVVEGDGIAFSKAFVQQEGGRVIPHKRFQTAIMVFPDGFKIDVATARRERYDRPAALPVVASTGIRQDLYRRDFTINSLAIRLNREGYGHLVDPFGGRRDLKLGIIRVLHNLSFVEDPTRIIRAVRFEQRYGFRMDKRTEHLLRSAVETRMLDRVNGQRLRDELVLLLKEEKPFASFARLHTLGVLRALRPPLHVDEQMGQRFRRIDEALSWFRLLYIDAEIEPWIVYLLALMDPLSPRQRRTMGRRLNLHRRARAVVEEVISSGRRIERRLAHKEFLRRSQIYRWLQHGSTESLLFLMARSEEEQVKRRISLYLDRLQGVTLHISGRDLIAMGVPEGPVIGEILQRVLDASLDGEVESKEQELALAAHLWEAQKEGT